MYLNPGTKRSKIWLKVRTSTLANLFGVNSRTILRWVHLKKLNPRSLLDIIEKYRNPGILDKRKTVTP